MKMYLASLAAGLLVGAIYGLINVRSPAPPVIALIGLLGILLGEQLAPIGRRLLAREQITATWLCDRCLPHVFGELPEGRTPPINDNSNR